VEPEEPERQGALDPRAAAHGGEDADRDRDEVGEEDRRERERRRHGEAAQDLLADRDRGSAVLAPEVEGEEPVPGVRARPAEPRMSARGEIEGSEEVEVLLPERLVEQVLRAVARAPCRDLGGALADSEPPCATVAAFPGAARAAANTSSVIPRKVGIVHASRRRR
jgi:hypothetical protein